ncbi:MAG: hypothetical protein COT34_02110 [Candidatus Nealsonbacteria bacterium CG08_land_8_20_14_0_20_43_11]|uniref:4-vinyl reductase 4VR domain-containing protein n=1 Tax=Candidatus Nealsonbacteria bacterium CG08_land_8_20_14_0_20_43_11 TaxID=1974706 RepID=A0A2M6T0Q2_9BACT|nr:MAG: hypothetical protein COT34_02110 [Candidatus Nealsonbacteria bacterium CG08_land_8_20_14_0_20_43_11]
MISNEELERIKNIPGEAIGASIKEDLRFVLIKEGTEGLKKVEDELERLGYPLKLKEIKTFHWYPFSLNLLITAIAKEVFQWEDETFREAGRFSAKISIVLKILVKSFIALEDTLKQVGRFWRMYYTVGEVSAEYNKKERTIVVVIRGLTGHPAFCRNLEGFTWQVFSYHLPTDTLVVKEIECPFTGGSAHKFQLKW